jgi:hypothetical protein
VRTAAATFAALALALAGCGRDDPAQEQPGAASSQAAATGSEAGVTPMAERVAVIGLLNKRNGIVRDLTLKPGQSVRLKDAVVRLQACETTAPWENEKLTGAFLQLEVQGTDQQWRRVFSGWVYKESPSLNVVEHPVYDVWPKSCAMTFPAGPPAAGSAPSQPSPASSRSSAQRSPEGESPAASSPAFEPEPEEAPASPPSAAVNNST